jgi:hypothetical protein
MCGVTDMPMYGVSMYNGGWTIATHPLGHLDKNNNRDFLNSGHSAWINFGKLILNKAQTPVGLIPCALNGSSMDMWKEGRELFNRLIAVISETNAGNLIWYQGCSDVFGDLPDRYEDKLNAFIGAVKKRFQGIEIYLIQISGTTNESNPESGWRRVRESQRRAAITNKLRLVPTYDLIGYSDDIHIGSKDNIALSERVYKSYISGGKIKPIEVIRKGNNVEIKFTGYKDISDGSVKNITLLDSENKEVKITAVKENNIIKIRSEKEARFITLPFYRLFQGKALTDSEGNPVEYFYIDLKTGCNNAL